MNLRPFIPYITPLMILAGGGALLTKVNALEYDVGLQIAKMSVGGRRNDNRNEGK